MKRLILIIMLSVASNTAIAQNAQCSNPPNCIQNPELLNVDETSSDPYLYMKGSWYTSHGTPTPHANAVWLWSYDGGGEGMYTCFNFQAGKQYKLCITIQTENLPGSLAYENPDALFFIEATNGNFSLQPVPQNNQLIAAWHAIDQVPTTYTYTFTADDNYNKLWVFPYMAVHAFVPEDQYMMYTFNAKIEEVIPAPSLSILNDEITVINSPASPAGHWLWEPSGLIETSNANGSIITVSSPCVPTVVTGTFISDCQICTSYSLQTTIGTTFNPDTGISGNAPICEGSSITLTVNNPNPAYSYQWMQIDGSVTSVINDGANFTGTNTSVLTIVSVAATSDGLQYFCVISNLPNCTENSDIVTLAVSGNLAEPVIAFSNPACSLNNGFLTVTSPSGSGFSYSIDAMNYQANPVFENLPSGDYTVSVISGSCSTSKMVALVESDCMIPHGISPNNDGLNDSFDLSGFGSIQKVEIFSRYGVNIYSKDGYLNEWKGQAANGKMLPSATYYYVIFFANGEKKTGWVYLIREG